MNGVCGDVGVPIFELDRHYNKIMDMVEVLADKPLGDVGIHIVEDDVSGRSVVDFSPNK